MSPGSVSVDSSLRLERETGKSRKNGFVAAREMTNEEMREAAQKRRQAAALQSALGINSCVGRGAEEEFLTCIVDSR
jgi:hypothetical protein